MDRPIIGRDRVSELTTASAYRQALRYAEFLLHAIHDSRFIFDEPTSPDPEYVQVTANRPRDVKILQLCRLRTSDRNSSRVCLLLRNSPSIALVTACPCCFSTPRICIHRCRASMITPTPCGAIFSSIALAIWLVIRSWICNRRANIFTSRATLLNPITFFVGR